jgi:hypothetical protein
MRSIVVGALAACLSLAACGGHKVLVSRGTTVPTDLQVMSDEQLFEYFKVKTEKGYKDGSSLTASVVMVDMAYLKASGQTLEATPEEMETLSSLKRFEIHIEYRTPNILFEGKGEAEGEGMAIDKWTVTLIDSTGTKLTPEDVNVEPPIMQKESSNPEESFDSTSKLILTYILKGNLIFDYQIPEGCKWLEVVFVPPQTGHEVATRWILLN